MESSLITDSTLALQQRPVGEISGKQFDVLIVGAGPAGTTAAIDLSRRGFSVALLDRSLFPREKICGDCLLGEAVRYLELLGVAERIRRVAHRVPSMQVYSANGTTFEFPADILTIKRSILDTILAQAAVESGTLFCHGTVTGFGHDDNGRLRVELSRVSGTVSAQILLVATGAGSLPLSLSESEQYVGPTALAIRCYVRSNADIASGILSYDRSVIPGFAWIFPLGEGIFNIGCGTTARRTGFRVHSLRKTFERFVSHFQLAMELFRHGERESPLRGFPLQTTLARHPIAHGGRMLTIGEAAGTTYRFTGEGISPAIKSALIAADIVTQTLISNDFRLLEDYAHRLAGELTPRKTGFQRAEKYLSNSMLSNFAASRIRNSTRLQSLCAGIIAGTSNPSAVYSAEALLRSIWRK